MTSVASHRLAPLTVGMCPRRAPRPLLRAGRPLPGAAMAGDLDALGNRVAANGDLTLVASTANDTTLFAATNTAYTRTLKDPTGVTTQAFSKVVGNTYAIGVLVVTAATSPTLCGLVLPTAFGSQTWSPAPSMAYSLSGQADLPASVDHTALSAGNGGVNLPQFLLLP